MKPRPIFQPILLTIEKGWSKFEKKLLEHGLSEEETGAIKKCFYSLTILPSEADIISEIDQGVLTGIGKKAEKWLAPKLALQFYSIAKNKEQIANLCLRVLDKRITDDLFFFAIAELNGLLDLGHKFDDDTLEKVEAVAESLSSDKKAYIEKTAREAIEEFLTAASEED